MKRAFVLLLLGGCRQLFGLDSPERRDDEIRDAASSIDDAPPSDAAIDAPTDARVCPSAPTDCELFTCAGTSSCYYRCSTARDWASANTFCAANNIGCLATIESQVEQNCLVAETAPGFPQFVWFGLRQASGANEPAGGWGWACGTSTYTNWGTSEPNDFNGNEDCGALTTGGGWFDSTCSTTARFTCKLL